MTSRVTVDRKLYTTPGYTVNRGCSDSINIKCHLNDDKLQYSTTISDIRKLDNQIHQEKIIVLS